MANTVPWALSHTQITIEVVATVAFALSGVIDGARKRLDAVGICLVAGLAERRLRAAALAMDWRLPAWQAGVTGPGRADETGGR